MERQISLAWTVQEQYDEEQRQLQKTADRRIGQGLEAKFEICYNEREDITDTESLFAHQRIMDEQTRYPAVNRPTDRQADRKVTQNSIRKVLIQHDASQYNVNRTEADSLFICDAEKSYWQS